MEAKVTRREFSERFAFGSFWAAIGTAVLGMMRLPKPSVMPEASTRIKLGKPEQFAPGTSRALAEQNVFLFSDTEGIWALSATCTHLGCIVSREADGQFDCPCHGSRFDERGTVTAGPAPRALDWLEIQQAPNGQLYVDSARSVPGGTKWRRG